VSITKRVRRRDQIVTSRRSRHRCRPAASDRLRHRQSVTISFSTDFQGRNGIAVACENISAELSSRAAKQRAALQFLNQCGQSHRCPAKRAVDAFMGQHAAFNSSRRRSPAAAAQLPNPERGE